MDQPSTSPVKLPKRPDLFLHLLRSLLGRSFFIDHMVTTRSYQIIENYYHPISGAILIENALWQVQETKELTGCVENFSSSVAQPTILRSNTVTFKRPELNNLELTAQIDTFHCRKYGLGCFIRLNTLPITAKFAITSNGMLVFTRDNAMPLLHVTAPAPMGHEWVYTIFFDAYSYTPRLELFEVTRVQERNFVSVAYATILPNCSYDGTTCIGNAKDAVSACNELTLSQQILKDIIFGNFNNDLFPTDTSVHVWSLPRDVNVPPIYTPNTGRLFNRQTKLPWHSISLS